MIFLDSCIWTEYFEKGENWKNAEKTLDLIDEKGGIISTFVLFEVKYVLMKKFGLAHVNKIISIIKEIPNLAILPVTEEVAERAATYRRKYNSKGKTFSSGDAILLATAILSNCEKFYTWDSEFENVDEIEIS